MATETNDNNTILRIKKQRLKELEENAALRGIDTSPQVRIEIKQLKEEIERVERWMLFPPTIVTKDQIDKLFSIVKRSRLPWTREILLGIYELSAHPGPRTPQPQGHDAAELLDDILYALADTIQRPDDNIFPILEFVERLALETQSARLRNELQAWVNQTSLELGGDVGLLRAQIRIPAKSAETRPPYLLIKLKPTDHTLSNFTIIAWIWYSAQSHFPLAFDKAKQHFTIDSHIHELPTVLDTLLEASFYALNRNMKGLSIELFVPYQLFIHKTDNWPILAEIAAGQQRVIDGINVDNWPIKGGINKFINLGCKYPIAMRPLERISDESQWPLWEAWYDKWEQFCSLANAEYDEPIAWLCSLEQAHLLDFEQKLSRAGVIGAVSLFIPSDVPLVDENNIVIAMLNAGMPIAFWVRCAITNAEQDYRALLTTDKLSQLPHMLWNQRKQARATKSDIWHHITLLWDDPNRLPPDRDFYDQLRVPPKAGEEV